MSLSLADLMEAEQREKVARGLQKTILTSFDKDNTRMTRAEVKRRFKICERIFCELRMDLGWSVQRILDHLPNYLRCELDGKSWEPDNRLVWVPGNGRP
jgi:hypothetical protein